MEIINFTNIKSLLFNNTTVKQTIFKNTLWLTLGIAVSKFLKIVLIVYVARILGATEYGMLSFALAFVSIFIVFADLGLSNIIIREFAREKENEKEFYSILSLKILLTLGALMAIFITSFSITSDIIIRKIIWILAMFSMVEWFSVIFYVFFQARQKMEYQSFAVIFESLAVTIIGFFVILNYPSAQNLSYAYLGASLIGLIFVLFLFHFKFIPLKISWQRSVWRKFLLMAWPLALAGVFTTVYNYIDSIMMGSMGQITETGWYNAAYRITAVFSIPLGLIFASFFPMVSKFFKESKEKLQKAWNYQMEIIILVTLPLMVGGIVLAPKIIDFVYGSGFTPAILAFQILIITAGISFFCTPLQYLLIAANQEKNFFWITSSAALVNIILNFILIPRFSLYGAAAATAITYILILILFLKFIMKFAIVQPFSLKLFPIFISAFLSSALMYFAVSQPQIYHLNVFFSILIGVLVYGVAIFFLRKSLGYLYAQK